jgi:Cu-Zn family superoxide dismutase
MTVSKLLVLPLIVSIGFAAGRGGGKNAKADLYTAQGQKVGTATFVETSQGVRMNVKVSSLPTGPHAIHIHEKGSCEPPDFKSAGAHFNPHGKQHGSQNPQGAHAGDLPNLDISGDGQGVLAATVQGVTLGAGENSLLRAGGTAVVIHAKPDDFKTDPAGNAGDRIACGVIKP